MTDLATRYGAPTTGRRRWTVLALALALVALLVWAVWTAMSWSRPEVTSELVSYDVVDDHTATATFRVVRRTSDVEASCLLRAQAADHVNVGELTVTVGPGQESVQMLTETVRTERLATMVEVVGCTADGQSRRR